MSTMCRVAWTVAIALVLAPASGCGEGVANRPSANPPPTTSLDVASARTRVVDSGGVSFDLPLEIAINVTTTVVPGADATLPSTVAMTFDDSTAARDGRLVVTPVRCGDGSTPSGTDPLALAGLLELETHFATRPLHEIPFRFESGRGVLDVDDAGVSFTGMTDDERYLVEASFAFSEQPAAAESPRPPDDDADDGDDADDDDADGDSVGTALDGVDRRSVELITRMLSTLRVDPAATPFTSIACRDREVDVRPADPGAPTIDVWYGDVLRYGHDGVPQPWINVLGNVSDPDGVASLSYTLNGGERVVLAIGPDGRRLATDGDFNADIRRSRLGVGENLVVLRAADVDGNVSERLVVIEHPGDAARPAPSAETFTIDWSGAAALGDVAQVVDGKWELVPGGVRPAEVGYDRLLAIGDVSWADYEVETTVTFIGLDPIGFRSPESSGAGFGVIMRWNGHTDTPVPGYQPKAGWVPHGAIGWTYFGRSAQDGSVRIDGNGGAVLDATERGLPAPGETYSLRVRIESSPAGPVASLKIWPVDDPEPEAWALVGLDDDDAPESGAIALVAHHADVTFGDVTVRVDRVEQGASSVAPGAGVRPLADAEAP